MNAGNKDIYGYTVKMFVNFKKYLFLKNEIQFQYVYILNLFIVLLLM